MTAAKEMTKHMASLSTRTQSAVSDSRAAQPRPVLYIGCPQLDRPEVEKQLASANLSVRWVDALAHAIAELDRREAPVLVDLSHGTPVLQLARQLRAQR